MNPQQPPAPAPPPMSWQAPEPELGPAPGVRFAGHGARLIAYIIDAIIVGVVLTVLFIVITVFAVGAAASGGDDAAAAAAIGGFGIAFLIAIVLTIAYFPYFWWKGGATPGMRLFRLRVVRDSDGGPISGGQALLRLLGYWVNQVALYIGFAWILVDKRRRGWHDLIAGTVVIEQ
jgi:uncharacterized RDD family membrane protein YckC